MAEIGWISLHRKIKDHWLWKEKPFDKRSAWIDLLLMANYEDKKFLLGNELVEAQRGQIITSEVKLSERWGWSRYKVQTFLKILIEDGMLMKESDTKKTILRIVNFSDYQDKLSNDFSRTSSKSNSDLYNKKAGLKVNNTEVCGDSSTANYTADYTTTQQQPNSDPTSTQQRASTNNKYNKYNNYNKYNKEREEFTPPAFSEVENFCLKNGYISKPKDFINYYESVGWVRGGNKIFDWRPVLEQWEAREKKYQQDKPKTGSQTFANSSLDVYDLDKLITRI